MTRNGEREGEGERERERERNRQTDRQETEQMCMPGHATNRTSAFYRQSVITMEFALQFKGNVQLSVMLGGHLSGSVENISTPLKRTHHYSMYNVHVLTHVHVQVKLYNVHVYL